MSGFHPVLGLLAVAVCISYSEGAPFSGVRKDAVKAYKLQNTDFSISVRSAKDAGPMPSALHNKNNIAKRDDSQDTSVTDDRNSENIFRGAGLHKLNYLRNRDENDILTQAKARESGSEALDADTAESTGLLEKPKQSQSEEESSSGSEGSETVASNESDGSDMKSVLSSSQSEEECNDDETTGGNDVSTLRPEDGESSSTPSQPSSVSEDGTDGSTITSSPTSPSNDEEEECEETKVKATTTSPPTTTTTTTTKTTTTMTTTAREPEIESSSSESVQSSAQSEDSQESEECDDKVSTTSAQPSPQTTTPTKKPRDPNRSSGSFHDSDPDGVDFSDSYSQESRGRSTEFIDT